MIQPKFIAGNSGDDSVSRIQSLPDLENEEANPQDVDIEGTLRLPEDQAKKKKNLKMKNVMISAGNNPICTF